VKAQHALSRAGKAKAKGRHNERGKIPNQSFEMALTGSRKAGNVTGIEDWRIAEPAPIDECEKRNLEGMGKKGHLVGLV